MAQIHGSSIQQSGTGNVVQVIGHAINDGKPFDQCSASELEAEKEWRKQLLNSERRRHMLLLVKLALWLLTGSGATWLSATVLGFSHLLTVLAAAVGAMTPAMAIYALSQKGDSEFASRQVQALREISYLLREKDQA